MPADNPGDAQPEDTDTTQRLPVRRLNRILSGLLAEMKDLPDDGRDLPVRWNIMHMYSSAQLAKVLAMRRGIDPELAGITAALHDIAVVKTGRREGHAEAAAAHVREFLRRYHAGLGASLPPVTDGEADAIVRAIARHGEKDRVSSDPLTELLKDVDALDGYLHGITTEGARRDRCRRALGELGIVPEAGETGGETNRSHDPSVDAGQQRR